MRTPREIYAQYKIMPSLQLHQLRVAAVGKLICDNSTKPVDTHDVILACLFHDMGNIIKFNLSRFPEFLEPEGLVYWQSVQLECKEKYGGDAHDAARAIAQEIGLSQTMMGYIDAVRYSGIASSATSKSFERKVTHYSDLRVQPHGIISLEGRLEDLSRRYSGRKDEEHSIAKRAAKELEQQIFAHSAIKPEDINDASASPLIEELWEYPVS